MVDAVVEAAREWLGTPYVHQASTKGCGADCLGLIRGVWRELHHGMEPEAPPAYTADWAECGSTEVLLTAAMRHLVPVGDASMSPGQVLLFRMRQGAIAKHLGILSEARPEPRFLHAYNYHGVIESPLTLPWRSRIVARFRFP